MVQLKLKILVVGLAAIVLLAVLAIVNISGVLASSTAERPAGIEGADSWTWQGPSHDSAHGNAPMVVQIVIDRTSPLIVYATTNQGVYRSLDGGQTWEPRNGGLGGYGDLVVTGLVIDPGPVVPPDQQPLTISTWGYGLFHSTNGGLNWSRLADPLAAVGEQVAGTDPEPPQVRAGGPSYSYGLGEATGVPEKPLPPGVLSSAGLHSGDERLEAPEDLPRPLPWTAVRRLAMHPTNPLQIWACIDGGEGLYFSDNGGTSWSHVSLGSGSSRTYTFAPSSSQIRYASFGEWAGPGEFYRTTNGGGLWTKVGGEGMTVAATVTAVAIHPTNPSYVLAATAGGGLYRSTNGGDSWSLVSGSLPDSSFYSVAFAPNNPTIAYAGGYGWVYRSGDTGATWANADTSFPTYYVEALAIHPTTPTTVLVGANRFPWGGVYRRTVDGASFTLQPTGMTDTFVLDLEQDPSDPNVLYAATWGGGVFRSDDGGDNWYPRYAVPYVYCLEATQGPTGTILYAGTFYIDWGVLKSYNRGDSWREVSWGYSSDISFDIMSLDGYSQNLVAATYEGVEYSGDGGVSWHDANGLNSGIVLKIARSPSKLLAATWGGGVWASTNGGLNWTESSTGLGGTAYVYDVAFSPSDSSKAYAASYGVYRSSSSGSSWSLSGIRGTYVRALDATGAPYNDVFAGTHDRGVYMAPGGINWWFDINTGLTELRIRSVRAVAANHLFAGTNGRGAWDYTLVYRPEPAIRLPLVLKCFPLPVAPTLYSISNPDGDGNYTVSWSSSPGATGYTLQEDDNPSFGSPATVYSGPATSKAFTGKPAGTYYYRVKATAACASSDWSTTQSVTVSPPVQPIVNGNFEAGPTGWQEYSSHGWPVIVHESDLPGSVYAHSGSWAAWLGGDDDDISYIRQQVTVPPSQPYLSYWHWIASQDICGYDFGGVVINDTVVVDVYDLCSSENTGGWVEHKVNLSSYAGQLVWLQIRVETDSSANSNLFVDDVSFKASALVQPGRPGVADSTQAAPRSGAGTPGTIVEEPQPPRLLHR